VIIPAAIRVDIGCGMMSVHTSLMADDRPEFEAICSKHQRLKNPNNHKHWGHSELVNNLSRPVWMKVKMSGSCCIPGREAN
jgi:RNA-splicing ligase RtcB